jgi:hypothetical protein
MAGEEEELELGDELEWPTASLVDVTFDADAPSIEDELAAGDDVRHPKRREGDVIIRTFG